MSDFQAYETNNAAVTEWESKEHFDLLTYTSAKDTVCCNIITEATEARNTTDALP